MTCTPFSSPAVRVFALVLFVLGAVLFLIPSDAAQAQTRGRPTSDSTRVIPARAVDAEAEAASDRSPRDATPKPVPDATAPDASEILIHRYRRARLRVLANQALHTQQRKGPLPLASHPTPLDTLRAPASPPDTASSPPAPSVPFVHESRRVIWAERAWFQREFGDTDWSFMGANPRQMTLFDTTQTRVLRARLQAQVGRPTQTLGDFDLRKPRDAYPQFEYWFVVNDSIPVKVTDTNGPYDRGLIVATDHRYRDHLPAIRDAVLAPLRTPERAPYVDYYYDAEVNRWYRAGYDGEFFFVDRTYLYRMTPGRRPRIDVRRPPSNPAASGGAASESDAP